MKRTALALATLAALAPTLAMAQAPTPMRLADPKSWSDDQAAQLWIKEFKIPDASGLLYQTYRIGQKSVTVFIGSSRTCDNGPNSSDSKQFWGTCPMQVVWQDGIKMTTRIVPDACFARLGDLGDPDPNLNGARTSYDQATGTITVQMLQNGAPVPACTKSVSVN